MEFRGGFSLVHTSPSNIATHESPVSLNPLPSRRGPEGPFVFAARFPNGAITIAAQERTQVSAQLRIAQITASLTASVQNETRVIALR
jgi:hypothetical protein